MRTWLLGITYAGIGRSIQPSPWSIRPPSGRWRDSHSGAWWHLHRCLFVYEMRTENIRPQTYTPSIVGFEAVLWRVLYPGCRLRDRKRTVSQIKDSCEWSSFDSIQCNITAGIPEPRLWALPWATRSKFAACVRMSWQAVSNNRREIGKCSAINLLDHIFWSFVVALCGCFKEPWWDSFV